MNTQLNLYILNILKQNFGENLTNPVIKSSISFCNFWEEFEDATAKHKLTTNPNFQRLAQAQGIDIFAPIRILNFLNFVFMIIGIVLLFFNWKIAILFFSLAILNFFYMKNKKIKIVQNEINKFNEIMMSKDNDTERFIEIIKLYCTGGIQLISEKGIAHLPLLPETCLTGVDTFPHHKYEEEYKILEKYKNVKNVNGNFDEDFGFFDNEEYDPDLENLDDYLARMKKIGRIDLYDRFLNYNSR